MVVCGAYIAFLFYTHFTELWRKVFLFFLQNNSFDIVQNIQEKLNIISKETKLQGQLNIFPPVNNVYRSGAHRP